jgi:hypothetical protein
MSGARFLGFLILAGSVRLGAEASPTIGVDEIRAGMRGYGESVFAGQTAERFDLEVLGVLRDLQPGTSYLLARLSGHGLEKSGVVAGMSGSPVWIDGRLAGAVAFSWPFSQEAIAGITPIAAMRGIERAAPWGRGGGAPNVAFSDLVGRRFAADPLAASLAMLGPPAADGGRPALVWSASGFVEKTRARLAAALPALAGAASGRSDAAGELVAGSSVAAVFVDGDLRLAATGTVTERDGDRILAFGHPISGVGELELPMASAEVVTVLGSSYSSFKIANTGPIVGTFQRDHAAGTLGRLGVMPRTIPLEVEVASPSARRYAMQLARIPEFLPSLAAVGTLGALDAATAAGGVQALDFELQADLGEQGKLDLRQSFDGPRAANDALGFLVGVLGFVTRTDLAQVDVKALRIRVVPFDQPRAAELVEAHAVESRLEPGATAHVRVVLRDFRGGTEQRELALTVPADLPAGPCILVVGDGASLDGVRFGLEPAEPRSFAEARELIGSLGSARQLGVLLIAPGQGVAAGGTALSRLPPSMRSLWVVGSPSSKPLRAAIVARVSAEELEPLAGLVRIDLEIERRTPAAAESLSASETGSRPSRAGGF